MQETSHVKETWWEVIIIIIMGLVPRIRTAQYWGSGKAHTSMAKLQGHTTTQMYSHHQIILTQFRKPEVGKPSQGLTWEVPGEWNKISCNVCGMSKMYGE